MSADVLGETRAARARAEVVDEADGAALERHGRAARRHYGDAAALARGARHERGERGRRWGLRVRGGEGGSEKMWAATGV